MPGRLGMDSSTLEESTSFVGHVRTMTFTPRPTGSHYRVLNRGVTRSDSHLNGITLAAVLRMKCKGVSTEAAAQ